MADDAAPHELGAARGLGRVTERSARRQAEEAASVAGVELDLVHEVVAATDLVSVVNEVWRSPAGVDRIDLGVVIALAHSDNYVVRARRDGATVGVAVGFFGPPGTRNLHSHIVGVKREAAGHGVGRAIKLHQRAWGLQQQVSTITWTCDPLLARNAWFNIARLGASPMAYLSDLYGPMSDGINAHQPTDRMQIQWQLDRPLPEISVPSDIAGIHTNPAQVQKPVTPGIDAPTARAVTTDPVAAKIPAHTGIPTHTHMPAHTGIPADTDKSVRRVEVPEDIETLRANTPQVALHWRTKVRGELIGLLDSGWQITGFQRGTPEHNPGYLLSQRRNDATA